MSAVDQKRHRIMSLIEAVLPHLDGMPSPQKADVFDGIAEVTTGIDPKIQDAAKTIADELRSTDLLQLRFKNLFTEEPNQP